MSGGMSSPLPSKRDVTVALLQSSFSVFVHLDPRRDRVAVPPQFKRQPHLVLEIGLNMPVPIHDLVVDDDGITCTLSFNRCPHWCRMPWASVFAVVGQDQRGMVWPDDVPGDAGLRFGRAAGQSPAPPEKPKAVRAVAKAPDIAPASAGSDRESKAEAADPPAAPDSAPPSRPSDEPRPKGRKLPPYLRVVK
jgi:stringent starvation protein B